MVRRRSKDNAAAVGLIIIVAIGAYVIQGAEKLNDAIGTPVLIGIPIAILVIWILARIINTRARRAELLKKYGDKEVVDRIMRRSFWQGQTAEQLMDSLGPPVDTDEKLLRKSLRRTWKYHQTGQNRYALRITLENDVVIGWDKKS
jgi:hypothetical protein